MPVSPQPDDAGARDTEARCPVCDAPAPHVHLVREMMFGTRAPFRYGECPACGLLWLLDVPDDLSPFYPPNYYAFGVAESRRPTGVRGWMRRAKLTHALGHATLAGAVLETLRPAPPLTRTLEWMKAAGVGLESRILDVGCGQGKDLCELANAGFQNVTGLDPFIAGDIEYSNGVRIRKGALGDVAGPFDLVMCHHALEHMDAPLDQMRAMAALLAPAGTLLIRIPLADSLAWERYGTDWVQLDAPRHLFLHTRKSMAHLERKAGLREDAVVYDSSGFGFWGSELYRRGMQLQSPDEALDHAGRPVLSDDELAAFERVADDANRDARGDQAAFYLRRA